jgi:hypothetical protein
MMPNVFAPKSFLTLFLLFTSIIVNIYIFIQCNVVLYIQYNAIILVLTIYILLIYSTV